jgi:hypothetical protein
LTAIIPPQLPARPVEGWLGFVPFYRAILMGVWRRNWPELLFRPLIISAIRAMRSVALVSRK